ncbi:DNA mismatch repair endonuclease MutL [Alicyclobacillus herbarius]|uniref:DNA mismatch repair endonuclease MutL n=1 Tax=Alicyclobacillus herbarius TaxID=122960 RepID=UPI002354C6BC|nr:DNA mismatch repair endonuclease MutL [Alicyclobacillus herbarius]
MGRIQVMPPSLANQIAAGEVVERPASVVKELVENSLDAEAKAIVVQLEEGGIARIVVQDDGVGMDEQDAKLAFARHATSKVQTPRDLFRIVTLGFRGEALASIAAVARVELSTRPHDAETGIKLRMEGSEWVGHPEPVGMAPGTRIEVSDLFFNTPARLKYLRTVATEQARCLEVVQRAALARPDVAFRCEASGRILLRTQGSGRMEDVLAAIYGPAEAKQFLPVSATTPDYQLSGLIGRPLQGRSSRFHGHLFINARPIRNLVLHQAVVAGYQGRLMINRHPMYALRIQMDPTLVDVNIHPHKAEVRLSEERDVARLVEEGVRAALQEALLIPTLRQPSRTGESDERMESSSRRETRVQTQLALERPAAFTPTRSGEVKPRSSGIPDRHRKWVGRIYGEVHPTRSVTPLQTHMSAEFPGESADHGNPQVSDDQVVEKSDHSGVQTSSALAQSPAAEHRSLLTGLRPIGQALDTYIIAEDGESLYLIDQHAAHERVLYERFKASLEAKDIHVIPLLTPIPLTLSESARSAVLQKRSLLAEMGLEIEEFGARDLLLRTIPEIWEGLDIAALAEDVLEMLKEYRQSASVREAVRDRMIMRACKAAIKANHHLSQMEMEALCASLADLEDPFHCPHGRPVMLKWTTRDLEKGFKRIV